MFLFSTPGKPVIEHCHLNTQRQVCDQDIPKSPNTTALCRSSFVLPSLASVIMKIQAYAEQDPAFGEGKGKDWLSLKYYSYI